MTTTIKTYNIFRIVSDVIENARVRGIELLPMPEEVDYEPCVVTTTPRGHYIVLSEYCAAIIAVDCYKPGGHIYDELIPGFHPKNIIKMETEDTPELYGKFVSIAYEKDEN